MRLLLLLVAVLVITVPHSRAGDAVARAQPPAKRIALSFDDVPRGPGAFLSVEQRDRRLIGELRRLGVRQVALFVNPVRINPGDGHEAQIDGYVRAGAVIANHTYSHPHLSDVTAAAYLADIDEATAWLKGRKGYRPWLRFPFLDEGGTDLAKRDSVRAGLAARGLRDAYVTVDGSDWHIEALSVAARRSGRPMDMTALRDLYVETMVQSADFSEALMVRALKRSPPHMLLLHQTDLAALFIGDLVKALRADGWQIVTADQAYADPVYRELPDTRYANGTLAEMLAWQQGLTGPRWYERNDTRIGKALFDARVLHETAS